MFRTKLQNLHHKINTFLSINGFSSNLNSLLQSHAFIITTGHTHNVYIAAKLISLYASNNNLISSRKVFDFINFKDPFLWNSIIKAYFSNGKYTESLEFYSRMRGSNALPNQFTVPMVVSACAELGLVEIGMGVHGLVLKLNLFYDNSAVGASLVYMYSKCGVMGYASDVFDEIPVRDVVSWTAIIKGYVENGESGKGLEYLCLMCKNGVGEVRPNFRTLEGGFQACGNLGALVEGKCFHGLAMKSGFGCYQVVQSSVLSMYSKCGSVEETYSSFCEVDEKDLLSWTVVIGVYAKYGCIDECIDMFLKMLASGISPDGMVISCVLSGLGNATMISEAKTFHGFILRRNFDEDHMVSNTLLAMYCKLRLLNLAEKIFNRGNGQNTEAWNVMAIGYWKDGLEAKCIDLFRDMQYLGVESDVNSLISVISSCSRLEKLRLGQSLHCHVIKNLMLGNVSVANSLIDMYGSSKNLTLSWRVFCMMTDKDVVTWNTMMTSSISCGEIAEAFGLFDEMRAESYKPNIATLVILLSASSQVSSLEKGEKVHQYIKEVEFGKNTLLDTALTDMYAKCGQLTKSREIFDSMEKKDIISWNVLISGYAMYGEANYAIEMFKKMEQMKIKPNELTFLAVLSACAHAGLVEEGKSIFRRMKDSSLMPTLKHYSCMVDLLGRSGNLDDAETLVLSMPIARDAAIWGSLLSSCKLHSQVEKGIRIAKHAIESDPENDGYYIAISDLYSSVGMWEEVEIVRKIMKDRKVRKEVGWSTV